MIKITLRTVDGAQHVDLVDNAIRARENAAAVTQDAQEASGYEADAAAVDSVLRVLSNSGFLMSSCYFVES